MDATIFESAARSGGRDTAAFYLLSPELFHCTYRLIHEIGLDAELIPISPFAGQFYKGEIYRHRVASASGLLSFKGLNVIDKVLLPRMAYLLSRHASELVFHEPERGLRFDNETVASYVKRELSQNVLNYVAGPMISTLFFYGSEETSAWLYLVLAKHMQHLQMSAIRGGTGRLSAAVSKGLRVVNGCNVRQIETDGPSYIIEGQRFSDVVIGVNGDAVLRIGGMETLLSDEDRQFFRDCRYRSVVGVRVTTDRPVDGSCYAVSIPRVANLTAATISFHDYIDPSAVPAGQGLLTVSGGGADVSANRLLDDLKLLYGIDPLRTEVLEWTSGMPLFPPGRYRQITQFRGRERRQGLFFCGDYLLGPLLEGAVASGFRAAEAIQN